MRTDFSSRRDKIGVMLIIGIYLFFAVAYSVVTPIGRGADEWAHYWYAQFIAENGRLPASAAEREAAGYKSDWPPLYHALAAAMTGWIDTAGPPTFKYRADSLRRQLVPASGPEAIVHTEDEVFPWRQEILVWHLGRFFSIALSSGTILVTYFVALEVFQGSRGAGAQVCRGRGVGEQRSRAQGRGEQGAGAQGNGSLAATHNPQPAIHNSQFTIHNSQLLALVATAVLAFNPRFIFTGMLFNYDSLTLLLSALFLLRALRAVGPRPSRFDFWALGALAGLALITKYLTLLLPLVIVLVAWLRGAEAQGRRDAGANHSQFTIHNSQFIIRALAQAAAAYLLVTGGWFAYLIITFNEIEQYGPLLGTLAPLLRGDGSDRTVEALFAWLSGGQAPPPAFIEQQSYSAGQIIASFFTTLWGNPIAQPYPLTWFIAAMAAVMGLALSGLLLYLRFTILWLRSRQVYDLRLRHWQFTIHNLQLTILLLTCLLPVPFMLARLLGARDALEAVQGRHILFLAGPAFAVLLVWGLSFVICHLSFVTHHAPRTTHYVLHFAFYVLLALLLTGAVSQLIFMATTYPPPAPVKTTNLLPSSFILHPSSFTLPGGAQLLGSSIEQEEQALRVSLLWQGGDAFAPEDYQLELALINETGEAVSGWAGVQTQARYPTRAWEPGDSVRDTGWLPLAGLPAGDYTVLWRLVGAEGPLLEWQTLAEWSLVTGHSSLAAPVAVWRDGQPSAFPPIFIERETAQFTIHNSQFTIHNLTGPDGNSYPPTAAGPGWANFIIQPHWPAGDYRLEPAGEVALRVAPSPRNFKPPAEMAAPLEASFAGQIKLLGYTLPSRRIQPGEGLPVTLFWQAQAWLGEEFVIFTRLLDNQQVAHGGYDRLARENYSTLLWSPGEVITDGFAVPVAADAPAGVYWLSVGWYRQVDGQAESLPLVNPNSGEPAGATSVLLGPIKVGGPPPGAVATSAQPENAVNASLGEQIKLLGFNSTLNTQNLELTLFWQALRQPAADYTVFVHLRDAAGNVIAQKDQPPLGGAYPTGLWDVGEIIRDEVVIPLEGVPPGQYEVVVGLYDFATGQRLPVEGSAAGEVVLLQSEIGLAQ